MGGWHGRSQTSLTFVLLLFVVLTTEDSPVVTVAEGQLKGMELFSREGNRYYAFLGIPYASIPARFEPPVPYKNWTGVRDATEYGPVCPQLLRGSTTVIGDEQCLYINVFTSNIFATNLDVIVYIHGGAFSFGSGNQYGGFYFLDQNVILVTLNYRLGALGFLSTGDGVIQGNNGLRDQNIALRWISTNIHAFGGGSRIMLMGESAGAASVAYHLLSPMSKGLFSCAVSQSGSALDPEHFEPDPLSKAIDLAENLDCPTYPTTDLAECLRTIDFKKIIQLKLTKWHLDPLVQFPLTIDVPRPGQSRSDLFLSESPYTLLEEGRFNKVPYVIGITEDEGLLFHSAYILRSAELQRSLNEDWNHVAPITLYYDNQNIPNIERNEISRKIRGFYFGDRKVAPSTSRNLTNLYSDRLFNWGTRTTALLQSKFSPVYIYIFGFLGDFSMLQLFYGDLFSGPIGTTHGDDLQFFFNSTRYPLLKKDSRAEQISKTLVNLWTSFASSGNMLKSLEVLKIPWLPVGPEEIRRKRLKWCYIDIESRILTRETFSERMEFWDKIQKQLQNNTNRRTLIDSTSNSKSNVQNKDEF